MVIGPLLQPTLNLSVEFILNIIKGVEMHLGPSVEYVDVRDVAYAHVCAFEAPSASGRYCIYGRVAHNLEILKILHDRFPSLFLHKKYEHDKNPIEPRFHIYNEKAKGLGVNFMPLETTLEDTILSLKEKNLLTIRSELCFSS